jgi:hypothetical protein
VSLASSEAPRTHLEVMDVLLRLYSLKCLIYMEKSHLIRVKKHAAILERISERLMTLTLP